tara:strand:+ start:725 stop:1294 length:570 start_codon:yes stop_codon:yes gene_type:complete
MINYIPVDIGQSLDKTEILDNFTPHKDWNFWSFEKLTETKGGKYGKNEITEIAKGKYPKLCDYISHLPFTYISNVKINIQMEEVKPHIDFVAPNEGVELYNNNLENEPSGYRIVVKGKNDVLKLHINDEVKTCYMPTDTDCYVINHTSGKHSLDNDNGRVTVYISGFINKDKHLDILNKSKNKYKKYMI